MVVEWILKDNGEMVQLDQDIPALDHVWSRWGPERKRVCYHALDIIREYLRQGIPLGVRQVAYILEARQHIVKTAKVFKKVGFYLTELRKLGVIPIHTFEDQTRSTAFHDLRFESWDDYWNRVHDQFVEVAERYRLPKWYHQPFHVEVWCEARGVAGTLSAVCKRLGVNLKPLGGQDSLSEKWDGIERLQHVEVNGGDVGDARPKHIVILYVGDHDPSGIQIETTARDDLTANKWTINIGGRAYTQQTVEVDTFKRIAVTIDQVTDLDLKANPEPAKRSDSNYGKFIDRYGSDETWEADAIEPATLARIVEEEVMDYWSVEAEIERDRDQWEMADELREMKRQYHNQFRQT